MSYFSRSCIICWLNCDNETLLFVALKPAGATWTTQITHVWHTAKWDDCEVTRQWKLWYKMFVSLTITGQPASWSPAHSSQLTPGWTERTDVNFLREIIWSEILRGAASPGFPSVFSGARNFSTWHGVCGGSVESEQSSRSLSWPHPTRNKECHRNGNELYWKTAKCETNRCTEETLRNSRWSWMARSGSGFQQQTMRWAHILVCLSTGESPQGVGWRAVSDDLSSRRCRPPLSDVTV